MFLSCFFISNAMLESSNLGNLISREVEYLGQGRGIGQLEGMVHIWSGEPTIDLFEGFLLNVVLTCLCKRYVTFDAIPILCPTPLQRREGLNLI